MLVFTKNMHGDALMPCKPSKARKLIKEEKAKIVSYKPFTIQLLYGSSGYVQETSLGIDLGSKSIGVAIVNNNNNTVLAKGEIILRQDVSSLIKKKSSYRKGRRHRKTRYRKARFRNRKIDKGWLPPSIQNRISNTFFWIDKFTSLLPKVKLSIEVGKFDIARMKDPTISGIGYQQGSTYGYYSDRYYVFERDEYTCQVCKKKNKILQTHHIVYESCGGTNKVDNLITICTDCHTHKSHQKGGILYKWMLEGKKVKTYKEPVFMNIIRKAVFARYPNAKITYGNITTPDRKALGLDKTHFNDAIATTGVDEISKNTDTYFLIRQVRKKKRSLHEATPRKGRKVKNVGAIRNSKNTKSVNGIHLLDEVLVGKEKGFVTGFTGSGCYVKDIFDNYITLPGKAYKQIPIKNIAVIGHNNNWIINHDTEVNPNSSPTYANA